MSEVVLDASALIASILRERGADRVEAVIDGALVSAVNLAEVVQRLVDLGASDEMAIEMVEALPCQTVALDHSAGLRAGLLRRMTRHRGLSLGDRACIALAMDRGLPVLTADCAWAELDLQVEVVLIR